MRKPPPHKHRNQHATSGAESNFWPELIKIAVSQTCRSMGFSSAQRPALEALTDIATRYLRLIAKHAAQSANGNSRTESNLRDVVVALEDSATVRGVTGGPNSVVKDLTWFVRYGNEIPFAQPMPRIVSEADIPGKKLMTVRRCSNNNVDRCDYNRKSYHDGERSKHVPRWLPDFPVVAEKDLVETSKRESVRWEENHGLGGDNRESSDLDLRSSIGNNDISDTSKQIEIFVNKRRKVRFKLGKATLSGCVRNLSCTGKRVVCSGSTEHH